jgi:2'-5' RNA ligase
MRLFIGVKLNDTVKNELGYAVETLRDVATGNFSRTENLHITLAFLGETDGSRIGAIKKAMQMAAAYKKSFTLMLKQPGRFTRGTENIVWYGVQGEISLLHALHKDVCAALADNRVGFDHGDFKPHITLGRRVRFDIPWEEAAQRLAGRQEAFEVDGIVLFDSARVNNILTYTPIFTQTF